MADKRNGRPPEGEAAARQAGETDVIVARDADEWRVRLAEQVADWQRRRAARQQVRAEMAVRRSYGLAARHSAKRRRSPA